jgi:hypothetical protein
VVGKGGSMFEPLHAHAAGLDLHALAVAVELVVKWAPPVDDA